LRERRKSNCEQFQYKKVQQEQAMAAAERKRILNAKDDEGENERNDTVCKGP
jgi:hypothetical protein